MTQAHNICPLCQCEGEEFYSPQFKKCSGCKSIFRLKKYFISASDEQSRYEEHNNDITDEGYQKFVTPMVDMILKNHSPNELGLDF